MLDAEARDGRTLRQRLSAAGPLDHDQLLWMHLSYFDPELELDEAKHHLAQPSAVCVGAAPPAAWRAGEYGDDTPAIRRGGRFSHQRPPSRPFRVGSMWR